MIYHLLSDVIVIPIIFIFLKFLSVPLNFYLRFEFILEFPNLATLQPCINRLKNNVRIVGIHFS